MTEKRSVSVAVHDPDRPGMVLLVQRPDDDDDLPGVWGLPAASLTPAETWDDAARRAGRDKLGVDLAIDGELQRGTLQRPAYTLSMRLVAARVVRGEPEVPQRAAGVTQYQAWRWGLSRDLEPAAARGSLCSQLYLRWQGALGSAGGP